MPSRAPTSRWSGACARERVERARGVVRRRGDGARQHLEVGLPRVTFERGVALTRQCQESLKAAQAKVEILATRGGAPVVEPFEPDDLSE